MADVTLSKAVRSNLLSLQSTAASMSKTQERLATGLKVNSALDNPTNFFTSQSLNSRASDMSNLLDSMSNGIQTIDAANNGLTSITKTVESMQSTLRQARQDKSFQTSSVAVDSTVTSGTLDFSNGSVGSSAVSVNLATSVSETSAAVTTITSTNNGQKFTVSDGTKTTAAITLATGDDTDAIVSKINNASAAAGAQITATNDGGKLKLTNATGDAITVADSGTAGASAALGTFAAGTGTAKTTDQLVSSINSNTSLSGKVTASNDNGKLRIQNQSTEDLTVAGASATTTTGSSSNSQTIDGNSVRKNLVTQFNDLRDQLDKFSDDASFNGINLLRGDKLKLTFNETGTSSIDIQAKDADGNASAINADTLNITSATNSDFDSDSNIDALSDKLGSALSSLRSQSSTFGSSLSIVQNRTDFTKNMINTLQTGAANLTLADTNEEAANLLALQTRQQLSSTALSMASQADQNVLRLF